MVQTSAAALTAAAERFEAKLQALQDEAMILKQATMLYTDHTDRRTWTEEQYIAYDRIQRVRDQVGFIGQQ